MNELYFDLHQFMELMKQTTENLKKMNEVQNYMRFQFGEPEEYEDFVKAMNDTHDGWMSSHC